MKIFGIHALYIGWLLVAILAIVVLVYSTKENFGTRSKRTREEDEKKKKKRRNKAFKKSISS